jgi:hypothetical protein
VLDSPVGAVTRSRRACSRTASATTFISSVIAVAQKSVGGRFADVQRLLGVGCGGEGPENLWSWRRSPSSRMDRRRLMYSSTRRRRSPEGESEPEQWVAQRAPLGEQEGDQQTSDATVAVAKGVARLELCVELPDIDQPR